MDNARLGTKLGPRIARIVGDMIVYTHSKLVGVKHKLAMIVFHAISDEISDEVDTVIGPLIAKLHEATPQDSPAYPAIHFMHTATGQLKALAGTGLSISGILGSLATIMNNELAPIVYANIFENPHLIPAPGDVAAMAATGHTDEATAVGVINSNGYSTGWAKNYIDMAVSYPGVTDMLEMVRRALIDKPQFEAWCVKNGIPPNIADLYFQFWVQPVSPADAALAVLRGELTQDAGENIALQSGVQPGDFGILLNNTGEPLGLEQLLEAYRRGFIDESRLKKGILQSRVRDEWIDVAEKLRYSPMSVADAVNAVVQNHLTTDQGESIAQQNGLEPGSFSTLYATAGEPLSRTEMEDLYNRGLVSEDDVKQALRESRVKNKYVDDAFQLHKKIVPIYTLQRALRYGGITQPDAVKIVMDSGYSKDDATLIVNSGSAERLQTYKDKVLSAAQSLYESSIMAASDMENITKGLGYSEQEAQFMVKSAEMRRQAKALNSVVSAIKSKYLERHIDKNTAVGLIDKVGIPASQRDFLVNLWDIEWVSYTKQLTAAQVVKAVKLELIQPADGVARLEYMGYSLTDAALLIEGA